MNEMIELIIPGRPTISLKNDRTRVLKKDGTESFPPSAAVTRYMRRAEQSIRQQLPSDFSLIEGAIGVIAVLYIKYDSKFPTADVSNSYETIQECLQGTVIYNDKQVQGSFSMRKRVSSQLAEHAELFVFVVDNNILDDMKAAIEYIEEKERVNDYES